KIRTEQEGGTARNGHPQLRGEIRIGKRLPVRARDAECLPRRIAARSLVRAAPGRAHLVTPVLAAPVFAAVDEVARTRAQRIVRLVERIDAAVAIVIDADIEPD